MPATLPTLASVERLPGFRWADNPTDRRRSYTVVWSEDFWGWGLNWKLTTNGEGHWCRRANHVSRFTTEAAAVEAGEAWVATGRDGSRVFAEGGE